MARLYFLILYLLACSPLVQAQELSAGPELVFPGGNYSYNNYVYPVGFARVRYDYGIGASVRYLQHITTTFGLALQTGITRFHTRNAFGQPFLAIPLLLGADVRYKALFAQPQVGVSFFADNQTLYQNGAVTYGITAGGYITDHVVLSGDYKRWNKGGFGGSYVGLRLAYAFAVKPSTRDTTGSYHPVYDKSSFYWRKHKTFKSLGWVSIGVGVPVTLLGLVTVLADSMGDSGSKHGSGNWVIGTGLTLTASSIPLFIFSHKYRKMSAK